MLHRATATTSIPGLYRTACGALAIGPACDDGSHLVLVDSSGYGSLSCPSCEVALGYADLPTVAGTEVPHLAGWKTYRHEQTIQGARHGATFFALDDAHAVAWAGRRNAEASEPGFERVETVSLCRVIS